MLPLFSAFVSDLDKIQYRSCP